jgi:hypothetical protein
MAFVAGVVEALVLMPVHGRVPQLPDGVPVAELSIEGARLIPITDAVHARFEVEERSSDRVPGFRELTNGIAHWAANLSRHCTVVYVHCEFWAGDGIHAAIAWSHGSVVFGPKFTRTPNEPAESPYEPADRPGMAINAALRAVGVRAEPPADEFATIGLDRRRWTAEWAKP